MVQRTRRTFSGRHAPPRFTLAPFLHTGRSRNRATGAPATSPRARRQPDGDSNVSTPAPITP
ncbi:hypothetical protein, partial [Burkholderia cenocepacia]|uniref:hypothetical protein n=1 Tax=Burkholderia cenocepacia TaxID=95486 RepID=UPI001955272F